MKQIFFDIAPTRDDWECNYAHMEYARIVWHDLWDAVTYIKVKECRCENSGRDDGNYTCWEHHNCRSGDCTHAEDDE